MYKMASVEGRLVTLLRDNLLPEETEIDLDADVSDWGATSLSILKFYQLLNSAFDIEIPSEEFCEIRTLRGLIERIDSELA
ncbi:MAG: acyl carrier protein [Caldilineaceae bacterium SB0665_bin_21]|nr:acyl carrier protein [Caldilineaceae bacterium SB0665_bin_21]